MTINANTALVQAKDTFKESANTITSLAYQDMMAMISDPVNYSTGVTSKELNKAVAIVESMIELYSEDDNDLDNILSVVAVYDLFYINDANYSPSDACQPFASFFEKDKLIDKINTLRKIDSAISNLEDSTFIEP